MRRTIVALVVAATALGLSACGSSDSATAKPCSELVAAITPMLDAEREMEIKVAVTDAAEAAYNHGDGDYATYLAARDVSRAAGKRYGKLAVHVRDDVKQSDECKTLIDAARRVHASYVRQASAFHDDDKASALIEIDAARAEWDRLATEYSA